MVLRLHLWVGVCNGDYTEGVMFAMAEDADEARALIRSAAVSLRENPPKEEELLKEPCVMTVPFGFILWGGS